MAISSENVIKEVSKKLKYYFAVQRLEDGFDLSGVECPRLDHPPTKARPTLQYNGLHDRPLKHYFSPNQVKTVLTQFKEPEGKHNREREIRRKLVRSLRRYNFNTTTCQEGHPPTKEPKKNSKLEASGGFGVGLKKRKSKLRNGQPVLRAVPTRNTSRLETDRLETIDLDNLPTGKYKGKKEENRDAIQNQERSASRRKTGRRKQKECESDSASSGKASDPPAVPKWLRDQVAHSWEGSRPYSAVCQAVTPRQPPDGPRPHSAVTSPDPPSPRTLPLSSRRAKAKKGWDSGSEHEPRTGTTEIAVQTDGELLRNYSPDEVVIAEGPWVEYEVRVFTGSRLGASTSADVRVVLIGHLGRSNDLRLIDSCTHKVKFMKGQEDVFKFKIFNVGTLRKIGIGHDRREIGFGWYLTRVEVRDMTQHIFYSVPCERWLSSQDPDSKTFRQFPVEYSTNFTPETEEDSRESPESEGRWDLQGAAPDSVTSRSVTSHSDSASHTSVEAVHSDGGSSASPRGASWRRASYTTLSSDSSTSTSSSYSSRSSSPAFGPTTLARKEEESAKPKPSPETRPMQRYDTFFDQHTPKRDYTSVIDSLSTTTDDRRNSQDLGEPYAGKPLYDDPKPDKEVTEQDDETVQLTKKDVEEALGPEPDPAETDNTRSWLRIPDPAPPAPVTNNGGLKDRSQDEKRPTVQVVPSESESESEPENTDRGDSIHEAAKKGDLQRVKKLIASSSLKKDTVDERGWAPVHIAAAAGQTDIVKCLAVNKAELGMETPTSYTAMHLAAMHGHLTTVIVLFAMGASVASESVEHQTPLHVAAMSGHLETVKWLVVNHAPLDVSDNQGRTALDLAQEYHHVDVRDFLRSSGCGDGLALIRSDSKRSLSKVSDSSGGSDSENDTHSNNRRWSNDRSPSPLWLGGGSGSMDHLSGQGKEAKADEHLMEKKELYDNQRRIMMNKNVSFLDAVRDEID